MPFKYTYRITALEVVAEFKDHASKATTRLRLDGRSKMRWLSWFGPKPMGGTPTTISVAALYLKGEASYLSPDPSCGSRFEYSSSRSHPVRAALWLDQRVPTRIRVEVHKFPLARALAGQDAGNPDSERRCGEAKVLRYDSAEAVVPLSVLKKPRFTVVDHHRDSYGGVESMDWTLRMTVQRLRYHEIDCATEPGC